MLKINLLVLDDDQFVRRVLADLFRNEYHVRCVATAAEFREECARGIPDVALIDVILPDGNGIDICHELRGNNDFKHTFIIIMTSFEDTASIENAYRYGANDYIRKPFIPFEIASKVALVAKNIEYQRTVMGLYERQKDINNKLFKMAQLINTNIHLTNRYGMLTSLFQVTAFVDTAYIEVILFDEDEQVISNKKVIRDGFLPLEYQKLKSRIPIFANPSLNQQSIKLKSAMSELVYCSVSCIYFNKQLVGYLILENANAFSKESLDLLSMYLDFVNVKGTDIYAQEQLRDEIRKDRKELAKVRTLQVSLLPHFQEIDKYDIASSFIPMEEISGDFFDGFYIKDGIYQIVVCDVAGHGVASSYVGSSIRGIIRSVSKEIFDLRELISYINVSVMRSMKNIYYFSSLVICHLEIASGRMQIVSAGHPPCLFYDKSRNEVQRVENTGPLLGLSAESVYDLREFMIEEGDCLFLYTDGLSEAQSGSKDQFGVKGIERSFAQCAAEASIDIVHTILGHVYEHIEYRALQDDVSLICLKKKGHQQ